MELFEWQWREGEGRFSTLGGRDKNENDSDPGSAGPVGR